MSHRESAEYLRRIEGDLRENILPFWMAQAVDRRGGFIGSLTNGLVPDSQVERGALLASRILWTYSSAYVQYRDPTYLAMAGRAYADLTAHFQDTQDGGFWWSIAADGSVLRDRKQVYGQAFAIYALVEYHRASAQRAPLDQAIAVYDLVEQHARDRQHGGYLEAFDRRWAPIADMRLSEVDLNEPKSQNTHLHLMEAYTSLLRAHPDAGLRRALTDLVEIMLDRIVDAATGHLGLFFAADWTPRSRTISYGHDIEAAWLLTRAAEVLRIPALSVRIQPLAVKIAEVTLAEGVDADGGMFNAGGPDGLTDTKKEWWPQAEAVVGFLDAYQLSGQTRFLEAAFNSWDFIERSLIDRRHGEWFRGVTRDGRVLDQELKISFWKCPYHNGRTGLEAVVRLREIIARTRIPLTAT